MIFLWVLLFFLSRFFASFSSIHPFIPFYSSNIHHITIFKVSPHFLTLFVCIYIYVCMFVCLFIDFNRKNISYAFVVIHRKKFSFPAKGNKQKKKENESVSISNIDVEKFCVSTTAVSLRVIIHFIKSSLCVCACINL